jgi:alpha-galactosidase
VNAGFQWNIFTRALDLSQAEVLEHVKDLIHTAVKKWGFSYLKLDFLYAAALKGKYADRTKTRAQILHNSLITIREAAGEDAILVGCGVPLGPSIGVFDAMRIGADVAPYWDPQLFSIRRGFHQETGLPSVRNALNNVLSRSVFHNRWWINDPDCLIIRPDSSLTLAEVQTQATVIALSGGILMLSDDLPRIPEERLRMIDQLLPPIGRRPRVLDWFDSSPPKMLRLDLNNRFKHWHLVSIINWSDEDLSCKLHLSAIDLPQGDYFSREFWSGKVDLVSGGYISINGIPPHGVCLLALTPITASMGQKGMKLPCYLGSDLHISQGLEVAEWDLFSDHKLLLRFDRPEKTTGAFDLFLPSEPKDITTEVGDIHWEKIGQDIYRFQGDLYPDKEIIISW